MGQANVSLEPEIPPGLISALSRMLAPDFHNAKNRTDLHIRLLKKGYQIQSEYLATAPQGKLICHISRL